NVVSTTGQGITLNGVSLSEISGASVDYAHGKTYIQIRIPQSYQDAISGNIILEVIEGTTFESQVLDGAEFVLRDGQWKKVSDVSFTGIQWNNIGYGVFEGKKGVLLNYSANLSTVANEIDGGIQSTNFVSTVGDRIKLGGTALKDIANAEICYHSQNKLWIYAPNMTTLGNLTFETVNFLDVILPELELSYSGSGWGVYVASNVVCQGIANDENNNILETNSSPYKYRTLLKYDIQLGTAANATNVVSTTGQGITLNGVSLSEISGASVDYAHGKTYIQIRIPQSYQDALVENADEVILEVIAGTTFESQVLDYAKFALISGQWITYQEPKPIAFATIFWNNEGRDVYAGKNGIMLSYSEYLSAVPNQVNGGMKEENLVGEEIGGKIKLDGVALANIPDAEIMYFGTSLLWIYVPNMDTYKELTIESTELLMSILPETHFALFNGKWAESFKITHSINGVEMVSYGKKNGKTVLGAEYYADLFADEDLSVKLVNFKVGNTVYNSEQTLTVNADTTVIVAAIGFETTQGAYIRLYNPTGIRFETKIDKDNYDYFVSVYGEANVETGTYIVPKNYLGITAFGEYFADETKTDGTDYVKIVNQGFVNEQTAETDGYYKYYGSLVNILPYNYCTDFFGIGYIKITDGNNEYTIYGGNEPDNYSKSIFEISKRAYKDFDTGTSEKNVIKGYLDGVVSIVGGAQSVEIENITEGYVSPYSVDYDVSSGE
ncbi:MAG: hypothetical protein J6Y43_05200, partial [Clostridia bacterium]|nr:hypothetical protein [Clostridia bacterium]